VSEVQHRFLSAPFLHIQFQELFAGGAQTGNELAEGGYIQVPKLQLFLQCAGQPSAVLQQVHFLPAAVLLLPEPETETEIPVITSGVILFA
jgi:hypothetical protein